MRAHATLGGGVRVRVAEAFEMQLGVGRVLARREAREMTVAHRDRLDIQRTMLAAKFEPRAEGNLIAHEQPMIRRHRHDAAAVREPPCDDLRKMFAVEQSHERARPVLARQLAIDLLNRGEELRGQGVHEFGEHRAIEDGDIFNRPKAAQRREAPRRLRARAAIRVAGRAVRRVRAREAMARGGREFDGDLPECVGPRRGPRLAEEFAAQFAERAELRLAEMKRLRALRVGVHEHEQAVAGIGGFAVQRVHRRIERAQTREPRAVEKRGMLGEELVQAREFRDEVVGISPVHAAAGMHVHFFRSEPFDTAREAEAAAHARERAEAVAQERPRAAGGGEAVVVVRFAVVDQHADVACLRAVFEVTGDFRARVILK